MRLATPQFTPFTLCDDPTPRMAEDITCVVLTGICRMVAPNMTNAPVKSAATPLTGLYRSEEHTSELQSRGHLVCRLLLEKKTQNVGHHGGVARAHMQTVPGHQRTQQRSREQTVRQHEDEEKGDASYISAAETVRATDRPA